MKVSYPVVFCRNAIEYAGLVCKSSPRDEQPPTDPTAELTHRQRLGELRCNIAYFDPTIAGWRIAENVRYISLDELVPPIGDVYYETGAPDPLERQQAYDVMQAKLARAKPADDVTRSGLRAVAAGDGGASGSDDERPSTSAELSLEESINEALLEAKTGDAVDESIDQAEGGPTSAELGDPLETRPVG